MVRISKKDRLKNLYEAALRVFARYGYKKATMEDIAHELDMVKGNLYLYVKDKRDLYEKAIHDALVAWQVKVVEAMQQEKDIVKQFRMMCLSAYRYLEEDENLRAIVYQDQSILIIYPGDDSFLDVNMASLMMIQDILERGIALGRFRHINVEAVSKFLFSVYNMFIIKTYVESSDSTTLGVFEAGVEVIINGLINKS